MGVIQAESPSFSETTVASSAPIKGVAFVAHCG